MIKLLLLFSLSPIFNLMANDEMTLIQSRKDSGNAIAVECLERQETQKCSDFVLTSEGELVGARIARFSDIKDLDQVFTNSKNEEHPHNIAFGFNLTVYSLVDGLIPLLPLTLGADLVTLPLQPVVAVTERIVRKSKKASIKKSLTRFLSTGKVSKPVKISRGFFSGLHDYQK